MATAPLTFELPEWQARLLTNYAARTRQNLSDILLLQSGQAIIRNEAQTTFDRLYGQGALDISILDASNNHASLHLPEPGAS